MIACLHVLSLAVSLVTAISVTSAAPLKLVYRGLGELSMIFSIRILIPGVGYLVTSGRINQDRFLFFIPLMLYGLAFILIVELPDMKSATGVVNGIMITLAVFLILVDGYVVSLALSQML